MFLPSCSLDSPAGRGVGGGGGGGTGEVGEKERRDERGKSEKCTETVGGGDRSILTPLGDKD